MVHSIDPHNLERFVRAQAPVYDEALSELRNGKKQSHWMWFIFPQFEGLGRSSMSREYSIKSTAEAQAYLNHAVLGPRLRDCATAVNNIAGRSAFEIFGSPDDRKLQSCATLFGSVSEESVFQQLLEKYFDGQRDGETIRLVRAVSESG